MQTADGLGQHKRPIDLYLFNVTLLQTDQPRVLT